MAICKAALFCLSIKQLSLCSKSLKVSNSRLFMTRRNGDHLVQCHTEEYESLLDSKVKELTTSLQFCYNGDVDVFKSEKTHFRMRANFAIWKDNPKDFTNPDNFYYCMYDENSGKNEPYEIKNFPRGSVLINNLMEKLMVEIKSSSVLFNSLFEARFVTSLIGQAVILLCYHIPLPPTWQREAEALSQKLGAKIVGRSKKKKLIAGGADDIIEEVLTTFDGRKLKYFQTEGAFSQPNAKVCEKMIDWTLNLTSTPEFKEQDLLELYCGGGTFTAALCNNFRSVLATEVSKASVDLANKCFSSNSIRNVKIARLSSEEFTAAFLEGTKFRRLEENGIDISQYNFQTVFVDPPRAGLDPGTCQLLSNFKNILYISCNPVTLARDLSKLTLTHRVIRLAAFDQFPYTKHLECGVMLIKLEESSSNSASSESSALEIKESPDAKRVKRNE